MDEHVLKNYCISIIQGGLVILRESRLISQEGIKKVIALLHEELRKHKTTSATRQSPSSSNNEGEVKDSLCIPELKKS